MPPGSPSLRPACSRPAARARRLRRRLGFDRLDHGRRRAPAKSRPAPPKSAFPATEGRSLGELINAADTHSELIVSPAAQVFYPGPNRYPFGIDERNGGRRSPTPKWRSTTPKVPAPKPGAKSKPGSKGQVAEAQNAGARPAGDRPLPGEDRNPGDEAAFQGKTTTEDPDAAAVVYSAEIDFPSAGEWRMAALIKEGDETTAALLQSAEVGEFTEVPRAGEQAPRIQHADRGGRWGGPVEDHDSDPAGHP